MTTETGTLELKKPIHTVKFDVHFPAGVSLKYEADKDGIRVFHRVWTNVCVQIKEKNIKVRNPN